MENVFKNFYRSLYLKSGGFISTVPANIPIYPGDFFQIHNGQIVILGNIFKDNLIDVGSYTLDTQQPQNQASWSFSDGVSKPFSKRAQGENPIEGEFEFSKHLFSFTQKGSFIFKGTDPLASKIGNWNGFKDMLIIKLAYEAYSFREVYVATQTVTLENWTLAVAGAEEAELELAIEEENFGLVDIFGHASAKTLQSKDIEYYFREDKRKPVFFKAKKMIVNTEKFDSHIASLFAINKEREAWVEKFYDLGYSPILVGGTPNFSNIPATNLLDMLQPGDLNRNTVLEFFSWEDTNLDDIELLNAF